MIKLIPIRNKSLITWKPGLERGSWKFSICHDIWYIIYVVFLVDPGWVKNSKCRPQKKSTQKGRSTKKRSTQMVDLQKCIIYSTFKRINRNRCFANLLVSFKGLSFYLLCLDLIYSIYLLHDPPVSENSDSLGTDEAIILKMYSNQ